VFAGGTAEAPVLHDAEREMTIREVLSHTSGLGTGRGNASPVSQMYSAVNLPHSAGHQGTLAGMMDTLGTLPLVYDPGKYWLYGIATDVVARLIEVLSGQRLDAFLRQRILNPIDMPDTGFDVPETDWHRFAANYGRDDNGKLHLEDAPATSHYLHPHEFLSGTGGMVSTMHDYARFARMLANGGELDGARIIGPRTLRYMASNHLAGNEDMQAMALPGYSETTRWGQGFGLGFSVLKDAVAAGTVGTVGESGWSGAAGTTVFISPGEDRFVGVMTRLMGAQPLRRELRTTIYGALVD
jgi:CubicO group peptidase (beta-lactamase class C family)